MKNKENYKKLKDQVSQGIHDELSKLKGNFNSSIAQELIKKVVPDKNASIVGKASKSARKAIKNFERKVVKIENKEKKENEKEKNREKKEKEKEKKQQEKEKKKEKKLLVKNMKGEVKKVIGKGDNRSKSVKPKVKSNIIITGDSDDTKENNLFCSDAQQLVEAVERISGTSENITECFNEGGIRRMRATKSADPQENWRLFGSKVRRMSGVLLLKTIGSVLKGIRVLNDEIEGRKIISLEERIKLFQLLDENEQIVDFLSQDTQEDGESEGTINKNGIGVTQKKEEEEDDYLVPSEHPEKITSLPELETKLTQINNLLDKKNLKPEDKKKLEQLKTLYLQQKNILIENKTEQAKKEVISQNNIDVNKYLLEEQERRKKAMEETQKKMDEEMKKQKANIKEEKSASEIRPQIETKIFRNQEMYKGTEPFTDPLFKPEKASLCEFNRSGWILPEDALDDDVDGWDSFKWCRVEELFDSKNYSVFHDGIAVEDIVQGKICDCYFLSVLGSLCKFPELIEKLFYFKEKIKEHIYGIYFYINGNKKLVLIDDFLLCIGI